MAVYDKVHELARQLKESGEYKEYQKAKQALLENDTAKDILKEYRVAQLKIQSSYLTGNTPDDQLKSEMEKIQDVVRMHSQVQRFIQAEERVIVMLADIQKILTEAMNLLEY
jgi:cell fate (sporulation/competence/biofilm development) regulator YlbF (YheA/YmcA/DUF963 family)